MTKQQFENSLFVIKLLEKIIKKQLSYSQCVRYQEYFNVGALTTDYKTLVSTEKPACLMGWMVTQKYAKKNGFVLTLSKNSASYNGYTGTGAFDKFVGFSCSKILVMGQNYSPKEALDIFKNELYKELALT